MSDSHGTCPACGARGWAVKKDRAPYCGPGDTNYIFCRCNKCGHEWEETD